jgi:hypothetical protein
LLIERLTQIDSRRNQAKHLARNAEKFHDVVKEGEIKQSDCPPRLCFDLAMKES